MNNIDINTYYELYDDISEYEASMNMYAEPVRKIEQLDIIGSKISNPDGMSQIELIKLKVGAYLTGTNTTTPKDLYSICKVFMQYIGTLTTKNMFELDILEKDMKIELDYLVDYLVPVLHELYLKMLY